MSSLTAWAFLAVFHEPPNPAFAADRAYVLKERGVCALAGIQIRSISCRPLLIRRQLKRDPLDGADRWSLMPINSRMFQELPKSTLLGVAVLVLLAGLFFALGFPWFRDRQAWTLCAAMYDKARSTADSAVIDAQQPLFGRGDAQVAVSCGALRSARSGAR